MCSNVTNGKLPLKMPPPSMYAGPRTRGGEESARRITIFIWSTAGGSWVVAGRKRRMVARARALSRRARAAISISRKPKNSLGREGGREGVGKMPKMTVGVEKVSRAALLLPFLRGGGSTFTRSRERDKILSSFAAFFLPFRYISNKIFRGEGAKFGSFSQTDVVALGSGGN